MTEKETVYYELLVLRCRRREEGALEELVRYWEKRLFYYIRRLVENEQDAWDILQQTWIKVIRGIRTLRDPRSLPTWLYRIARNTIKSHWRKKMPRRESMPENGVNLSPAANNSSEVRFENADQVHYGLSQISLPHREVLTLYFLEDFLVEDIAQILDIPAGTVKSRLHHAKRALKDVIQKESQTP